MGLIFLVLIPFSAFAIDCFETTPRPFPNPCDNLFINGTLDLRNDNGPVVINVTGVVEIKGDILLDGSPGGNGGAGAPGGQDGPVGPVGGEGDGGGVDGLSTPEPGRDGNIANGKTPPADVTCGNGGSGGGLFTAGEDGGICAASGALAAFGGSVAPGAEFDFGANFRGGYGGGAGGIAAATVGTGGGGGGALRIIAGGNVTIFSGVTISAIGGNGGNASGVDGAGGGGSGGALWIQAPAGIITNLGTINLLGGEGGDNPNNANDGGRGGVGVYQFEDSNGTSNDSGYIPANTSASNRSSLSSDISCGTIAKPNEKQNLFFQVMIGFVLASMFGMLCNLRRRHR